VEQNGPPPMLDLPSGDVDLKKLVDDMTEDDQKALLIQVFRMCQELVGFTRQVSATIDKLGDSPMMRAMGAGIIGPPNIPPQGRPPGR
jgi:hypothetical protein